MGLVCFSGATVVFTKEVMQMIKNMVTESSGGQMVGFIAATGGMESRMVEELTSQRTVNRKKVFGRRANVTNGWTDVF